MNVKCARLPPFYSVCMTSEKEISSNIRSFGHRLLFAILYPRDIWSVWRWWWEGLYMKGDGRWQRNVKLGDWLYRIEHILQCNPRSDPQQHFPIECVCVCSKLCICGIHIFSATKVSCVAFEPHIAVMKQCHLRTRNEVCVWFEHSLLFCAYTLFTSFRDGEEAVGIVQSISPRDLGSSFALLPDT